MPPSPEQPFIPEATKVPPTPEVQGAENRKKVPAMEYGELTEEEQRKMEIVEEQFNNPKFVEIDAPGVEGKKIKIEYIVLDARNEQELERARAIGDRTIIHVPGYGSSYRSPKQFVELLAVRGNKRVIVMSEPNHGGSDNAPKEWRKWSYDKRSFSPYAETLNRAIDGIRREEQASDAELTTEMLSVVSSSKGSFIAEQLAVDHPKKIADAVFLHPAGVEHESAISFHLFERDADGKRRFKPHFGGLGSRYFPETTGSKKETQGRKPVPEALLANFKNAYREQMERQLQELETQAAKPDADRNQLDQGIAYLRQCLEELEQLDLQTVEQQETDMYQGVTKGIMKDSGKNMLRGRYAKIGAHGLVCRLWEAFVLAKGGFLELLPQVKANTYIVFGSADKLFPTSQMEKIRRNLPQDTYISTQVLPMRHDEIYQRPRDYTERVLNELTKMQLHEAMERLQPTLNEQSEPAMTALKQMPLKDFINGGATTERAQLDGVSSDDAAIISREIKKLVLLSDAQASSESVGALLDRVQRRLTERTA